MTSTPPESAEVAGARARARVAAATPRRPVTVHVVSPVVRAEQAPAMMPPPPSAYLPRPVATSPTVTWEESIGGPREELLAGLRRALAASLAGVAPRGPVKAPRLLVAPMTLPEVPPLLGPEADSAGRRETIERVAVLIRGTVELAGLLATAPADVAERARAALRRVTP